MRLVVPHPEEEAIPVSGSETLHVTVTFPLFQPFAFGEGDRDPVRMGGVWSMLIPLTLVDALLPARSVHVQVTD